MTNNVKKPKVYAHLDDYQYALQLILNSLCILISVDGRRLDAEHNMPLSVAQILRLNKLYTIENTRNNGKTDYMVNVNSKVIEKIIDSDVTLEMLTV